MKKIIIPFLLLACQLCAVAQHELSYFKLQGSNLVWQSTYTTNLNLKAWVASIKQTGSFKEIDVDSNTITGLLSPLHMDCKGAGYNRMNVPGYISSEQYTGFVVLTYDAPHVFVTIKKIVALNQEAAFGAINEPVALEKYALKNGQPKKQFVQTDSKIFDHSFSKIFATTDTAKQ